VTLDMLDPPSTRRPAGALRSGDVAVALGRIAGALGALVAERAPTNLHPLLIAGAATAAARAAGLRVAPVRGNG
jgi:hypothetical protein